MSVNAVLQGIGLRRLLEYSPDQPRDKGRFAKGGQASSPGSRRTQGGPKKGPSGPPKKPAVGISSDQRRVTPRRAGLPENIGRSIFRKAGIAAGRKEALAALLRPFGMRALEEVTIHRGDQR